MWARRAAATLPVAFIFTIVTFTIGLGIALLGGPAPAQAQGTAIGKPQLFGDGIACDASLLPWHTVWYGHFSGGLRHYERGAPRISLVWRDEKLCFPSRRECQAWQRAERRTFHQIEGYRTCLRLR